MALFKAKAYIEYEFYIHATTKEEVENDAFADIAEEIAHGIIDTASYESVDGLPPMLIRLEVIPE